VFGDDVAIVDQDNLADQDAANVGIQDQDLTQIMDQEQLAENFNFDVNVQVAQQLPPPPPEPELPVAPGFGSCFTFIDAVSGLQQKRNTV
jgi:hypothetical protein